MIKLQLYKASIAFDMGVLATSKEEATRIALAMAGDELNDIMSGESGYLQPLQSVDAIVDSDLLPEHMRNELPYSNDLPDYIDGVPMVDLFGLLETMDNLLSWVEMHEEAAITKAKGETP